MRRTIFCYPRLLSFGILGHFSWIRCCEVLVPVASFASCPPPLVFLPRILAPVRLGISTLSRSAAQPPHSDLTRDLLASLATSASASTSLMGGDGDGDGDGDGTRAGAGAGAGGRAGAGDAAPAATGEGDTPSWSWSPSRRPHAPTGLAAVSPAALDSRIKQVLLLIISDFRCFYHPAPTVALSYTAALGQPVPHTAVTQTVLLPSCSHPRLHTCPPPPPPHCLLHPPSPTAAQEVHRGAGTVAAGGAGGGASGAASGAQQVCGGASRASQGG